MTTISIGKEELKNLLKEIINEVVKEEFLKMRLVLLKYVSNEEQEEIEAIYGKNPEEKEDETCFEEEIEI